MAERVGKDVVGRERLGVVDLEDNLCKVHRVIKESGRKTEEITIVAVTKRFPLEVVLHAREHGLADFGENFAQELVAKAQAHAEAQGDAEVADRACRWHMIGQIQRNKVKMLAPYVSTWHGLSSERVVDQLARYAPQAKVFVQVNLTPDPQRGGCAKAEVPRLVDSARVGGLEVRGLMAVADPNREARAQFAEVRQLGEALGLKEFSMGMSSDYRDALAEGATIVRLGSVLFGPRQVPRIDLE